MIIFNLYIYQGDRRDMQQTTTIFASYPHLQMKRLYNKRTVLIISTVRIFCIDQVLPLCHFPVARSKHFSCRSPDLSILILNRLPDFSVAALRLDLKLPNYSGGSVPDSHRLPSSLLLLTEHGSDLIV